MNAAPHPEDTQKLESEAPFLKLEERPGSGNIPEEAKGEVVLQPPGAQGSPTSRGLGACPRQGSTPPLNSTAPEHQTYRSTCDASGRQ